MNPGIHYLYEYRNNEKLRNVGFLKLSTRYRTCEMQINIRQIPVRRGDSLKLCVLFEEDSTNYESELGEISCGNNGISSKVSIPESDFPHGKNIDTINGFFLRSPRNTYYAAVDPSIDFHADNITVWVEKQTMEEPAPKIDESPALETPEMAVPQPPLDTALPEPLEVPTLDLPDAPLAAPQDTQTVVSQDTPPDLPQDFPQEPPSTNKHVQKIQRSDISILPRRAWNIANNSFLMHGYNNYNHLLLVEEDNHYWLGVPGIFSPREERAAKLFGFPQFISSYVEHLELGTEEKGDPDNFGHWCRYIR